MKKILRLLLVSAMVFSSAHVFADDDSGPGDSEGSMTHQDYDKPSDMSEFGGSEPSWADTSGGPGEGSGTTTTGSTGTPGESTTTPPAVPPSETNGDYVGQSTSTTVTPSTPPGGGSIPDNSRGPASNPGQRPDDPGNLGNKYPPSKTCEIDCPTDVPN